MTATYEYSNPTGLIVADTQDLLEDVQAEFRAALGEALNVDSSTPQGALIQSETIARTHVMRNNAEQANLINPNYSYGVALDALMHLTGSSRGVDISTFVRGVRIEGDPGTFIARGSRLQTSDGNEFIISENISVGPSGVESGTIQSVLYGDVPVHRETLKIIDGTIGWGNAIITSASTVTPGTAKLSDAAARNMRLRRLFALGRSSTGAIKAAALKVANVRSVIVVENNTGASGVVNGVTFLLPSALWVCVDGSPEKRDMASALFEAHRGGCPWDYGLEGEGVRVDEPLGTVAIDKSVGLAYHVKWNLATELYCWIKVKVKQVNGGVDPHTAIPQLIIDYADGQITGEEGFVVGAAISGFDIAGAISMQLPNLYIASVACALTAPGEDPPTDADFFYEKSINPWEVARASLARITVEVL